VANSTETVGRHATANADLTVAELANRDAHLTVEEAAVATRSAPTEDKSAEGGDSK
jgi:hypothetical protein